MPPTSGTGGLPPNPFGVQGHSSTEGIRPSETTPETPRPTERSRIRRAQRHAAQREARQAQQDLEQIEQTTQEAAPAEARITPRQQAQQLLQRLSESPPPNSEETLGILAQQLPPLIQQIQGHLRTEPQTLTEDLCLIHNYNRRRLQFAEQESILGRTHEGFNANQLRQELEHSRSALSTLREQFRSQVANLPENGVTRAQVTQAQMAVVISQELQHYGGMTMDLRNYERALAGISTENLPAQQQLEHRIELIRGWNLARMAATGDVPLREDQAPVGVTDTEITERMRGQREQILSLVQELDPASAEFNRLDLFADQLNRAIDDAGSATLRGLSAAGIQEFFDLSFMAETLMSSLEGSDDPLSTERRLQAATLYSQIGCQDRIREILEPVQNEVQDLEDPSARLDSHFTLAQIYQSAGMNREATESLRQITQIPTEDLTEEDQTRQTLAQAFVHLNEGQLEQAEQTLAGIEGNDQIDQMRDQIQNARHQQRLTRELRVWQGIIQGYLEERDETDTPEARQQELALHAALSHNYQRAMAGEIPNILSGLEQSPAFSANHRLSYEGDYVMVYDLFSNPDASDAEFARGALEAARQLSNREHHLAAMMVTQGLVDNPHVANEAQAFAREIPTDQMVDSVLGHLWSMVTLGMGADSDQEAVMVGGETLAMVAGFGVARWVGVGAEALYTESVFARALSPIAFRTGGWLVRSGMEGAAFTGTNMLMHAAMTGNTDHITLENFAMEWGSMMVTFGLLHGVGMEMQGLERGVQGRMVQAQEALAAARTRGSGVATAAAELRSARLASRGLSVANWASRVSAFTASEYVNEAIGLREGSDIPIHIRFLQSAVMDAQMMLAHSGVEVMTGGRIGAREQRTQAIYQANRLWPAMERMGFERPTRLGELSPEGQIALQGLMARVARGESPTQVEQSITPETRRDLERFVTMILGMGTRNAGLGGPPTAEGRQVMAHLFGVMQARGQTRLTSEMIGELGQLHLEAGSLARGLGLRHRSREYHALTQEIFQQALLRGQSREDLAAWVEAAPQARENLETLVRDLMGTEGRLSATERDFLEELTFYNFAGAESAETFAEAQPAHRRVAPRLGERLRHQIERAYGFEVGSRENQRITAAVFRQILVEGGDPARQGTDDWRSQAYRYTETPFHYQMEAALSAAHIRNPEQQLLFFEWAIANRQNAESMRRLSRRISRGEMDIHIRRGQVELREVGREGRQELRTQRHDVLMQEVQVAAERHEQARRERETERLRPRIQEALQMIRDFNIAGDRSFQEAAARSFAESNVAPERAREIFQVIDNSLTGVDIFSRETLRRSFLQEALSGNLSRLQAERIAERLSNGEIVFRLSPPGAERAFDAFELPVEATAGQPYNQAMARRRFFLRQIIAEAGIATTPLPEAGPAAEGHPGPQRQARTEASIDATLHSSREAIEIFQALERGLEQGRFTEEQIREAAGVGLSAEAVRAREESSAIPRGMWLREFVSSQTPDSIALRSRMAREIAEAHGLASPEFLQVLALDVVRGLPVTENSRAQMDQILNNAQVQQALEGIPQSRTRRAIRMVLFREILRNEGKVPNAERAVELIADLREGRARIEYGEIIHNLEAIRQTDVPLTEGATGVASFRPITDILSQAQRIDSAISPERMERFRQRLIDQGMEPAAADAQTRAWAEGVARGARDFQARRLHIYDTSLDKLARDRGVDPQVIRHLDEAVVDHHGRFANERNTTEQLLDRFETVLAEVRDDPEALQRARTDGRALAAALEGTGRSPEQASQADLIVAAAIRELNLRQVTTDNLADGAWSVWIARNQARVLREPGLRELIESATHFEDFSAFGTEYSEHSPGVRLQAALFQRYGEILRENEIIGSDRFSPEQAPQVMDAALRAIDEVLANPSTREQLATEFFNQVAQAVPVAADRALMPEGSVHEGSTNLSFFDLTQLPFTVFQQWLALPRVEPRQGTPDTIQVSVVPMPGQTLPSGGEAPRTLQIVAIPNGRELPSGRDLTTILERVNAAEQARAAELGVEPNIWFGKENVILADPDGHGTLLSTEEVSRILRDSGLFETQSTRPPSEGPSERPTVRRVEESGIHRRPETYEDLPTIAPESVLNLGDHRSPEATQAEIQLLSEGNTPFQPTAGRAREALAELDPESPNYLEAQTRILEDYRAEANVMGRMLVSRHSRILTDLQDFFRSPEMVERFPTVRLAPPRLKDPRDVAPKLARREADTMEDFFDLAGGRVIVENQAQGEEVVRVIRDWVLTETGLHIETAEIENPNLEPNARGYRAAHVNVRMEMEGPRADRLHPGLEIQVMTEGTRQWEDIQRRLVYKNQDNPHVPQTVRKLLNQYCIQAADYIHGGESGLLIDRPHFNPENLELIEHRPTREVIESQIREMERLMDRPADFYLRSPGVPRVSDVDATAYGAADLMNATETAWVGNALQRIEGWVGEHLEGVPGLEPIVAEIRSDIETARGQTENSNLLRLAYQRLEHSAEWLRNLSETEGSSSQAQARREFYLEKIRSLYEVPLTESGGSRATERPTQRPTQRPTARPTSTAGTEANRTVPPPGRRRRPRPAGALREAPPMAARLGTRDPRRQDVNYSFIVREVGEGATETGQLAVLQQNQNVAPGGVVVEVLSLESNQVTIREPSGRELTLRGVNDEGHPFLPGDRLQFIPMRMGGSPRPGERLRDPHRYLYHLGFFTAPDGGEFFILGRGGTRDGREVRVHMRIPERDVSREHAVIRRETDPETGEKHLILEELGQVTDHEVSVNGTYVWNEANRTWDPVTGPTPIGPGSTVALGRMSPVQQGRGTTQRDQGRVLDPGQVYRPGDPTIFRISGNGTELVFRGPLVESPQAPRREPPRRRVGTLREAPPLAAEPGPASGFEHGGGGERRVSGEPVAVFLPGGEGAPYHWVQVGNNCEFRLDDPQAGPDIPQRIHVTVPQGTPFDPSNFTLDTPAFRQIFHHRQSSLSVEGIEYHFTWGENSRAALANPPQATDFPLQQRVLQGIQQAAVLGAPRQQRVGPVPRGIHRVHVDIHLESGQVFLSNQRGGRPEGTFLSNQISFEVHDNRLQLDPALQQRLESSLARPELPARERNIFQALLNAHGQPVISAAPPGAPQLRSETAAPEILPELSSDHVQGMQRFLRGSATTSEGTPMDGRMTYSVPRGMGFVLYPNIMNSEVLLDTQGNILFVRHQRISQLGRGTGYESGVRPGEADLDQGVRLVRAVTDPYGRLLDFDLPSASEPALNDRQMEAMQSLLRLPENLEARQRVLSEYPHALDSAHRRGYESVFETLNHNLHEGVPLRLAVLPAAGNPPFTLQALRAEEAPPAEALGAINVTEYRGRYLQRGFRPGRFRFEVAGNVPQEAIELFEWVSLQTEDPNRLSTL